MTVLLGVVGFGAVMYGLGWMAHEERSRAIYGMGYEDGRAWRRGMPAPALDPQPRPAPFDWELHGLFDDVNNAREITAWMANR